jgi:hypothetical protein
MSDRVEELEKRVAALEGLLLARIGVSDRERLIRAEAREARRKADMERMRKHDRPDARKA